MSSILYLLLLIYVIYIAYGAGSRSTASVITTGNNSKVISKLLITVVICLLLGWILYSYYSMYSRSIDMASNTLKIQYNVREASENTITEHLPAQGEADIDLKKELANKDNIIKTLETAIADKDKIIGLMEKPTKAEAKVTG